MKKIMLLSVIALFSNLCAVEQLRYPYTLPSLGYSYGALQPSIDEQTMHIHLNNHHQGYIDKLNKTLESHPTLQKLTLKELLLIAHQQPKKIRLSIEDNGGGHYNHSLFWLMMSPQKTEPTGSLLTALQKSFKSLATFKQKFTQAAVSIFGSGWAWLCVNKKKRLVIITTSNQNSPVTHGLIPILGLDVWEHAYYLKYKNKRADYIDAWWNVVNWSYVQERYDEALRA